MSLVPATFHAMPVIAAAPPPTTDAVLSLTAIASLAGVQRPVVTVWRRRYAASADPFPAPVTCTATGQELFCVHDVVSWLQRTGLGNNTSAAADAALHVALGAMVDGDLEPALHAVTAVLTLKACTGVPVGGLTAGAILDLADDVDPHDGFLYTELEQLGEALPEWGRHADAMADAGYSAPAALEHLVDGHRGGIATLAEATLAPALVDLAAQTARALLQPGAAPRPLVDISGGAELLRALVDTMPTEAGVAMLAAGDSRRQAMARLARRRLVASGADASPLRILDGDLELPDGALVVSQLPDPVTGPLGDAGVVERLEQLDLAMHDSDRAVVVGPASALTDRASAEVGRARADVLRSGRVRAVVKLPAGLWLSRSRQQTAMWVLARPSAPVADERWVAVADLSGERLTQDVVESVVDDVVAACGDRSTAYAHAFRFARLTPASTLQAARGDLVRATAPPRRPRGRPADAAALVHHLAEAVSGPLPALPLDVAHGEHTTVRTTTLGELVRTGAVKVVAGNRFAVDHLLADGDVPVFDADDVAAGRRPARGIDRLTFTNAYPRARYTEPGDVVVTSGAGAVVDDDGFAAVLSPARVLRVRPGREPGLTPYLLASAVRAARPRTPWRAWTVRLAPPGQARNLDDALRAVTASLGVVEDRRRDLHTLAAALTESVTAGGLTLNPPTEHDDAFRRQRG